MEILQGLIIVGVIVLLVFGYLTYKDKQKEKSKNKFIPPTVLPPIPTTEDPKPVVKEPVKVEKPVITRPPKVDEPAPVEPEPPAIVEPPKAGPKKPVGGKLPPRNPDPDGLWRANVARKTKNIPLVGSLKPRVFNFDKDRFSIPTLTKVAFRFEGDPSFQVGIALTSLFYSSVIYLCNEDGDVLDFCISAPGAPTNEMSITYNALDAEGNPTIKGGAYIVQVADGQHSGAQYYGPRKDTNK